MPAKKTAKPAETSPSATKLEWGKILIPALIGLLGVVTTAVCGFLTTVVVNVLPNSSTGLRISARAVGETPTITADARGSILPTNTLPGLATLPTITFELMDFNIFQNASLDIYGRKQGKEYLGIVPEQCFSMYIFDDPTPNVINRKEEVPVTYNFLVLSDKPIIISEISLYLDDFQPPPKPEALADALYVWGRGGGEVEAFTLDDVAVSSLFDHASLNGGKAYRLEENDALTFSTTLEFVEPGEYSYHFELIAETFGGDTFAYASGGLSFSWLYLDDVRRVKLTNEDFGEEVRAENPPCP